VLALAGGVSFTLPDSLALPPALAETSGLQPEPSIGDTTATATFAARADDLQLEHGAPSMAPGSGESPTIDRDVDGSRGT
jgi:hypothetical protein